MIPVAVWCPGDGLGHLTRAVAALHTLGVPPGDAVLLSNSASADDPRITNGHRCAPATLPVPACDELWVDALPCSRGELDASATSPAHVVRHLARRIRWDAYAPVLPESPPRFATTWITEDLDPRQHEWLSARSDELAPLELDDPPPPSRCADRVQGSWLVVHAGPSDERDELLVYARDVAAAEGSTAPIVVVDTVPAWPLFASAATIVSAAGANTVRQVRRHAPEVRHLVVPFARRWDDQPARAREVRQGMGRS